MASRLWKLVIDAWSYLNYKSTYSDLYSGSTGPWRAPGWIPAEDKRRLEAYKMYESYYRIMAREWLDASMPAEDRKVRREYGDPYILVETSLSSLLGQMGKKSRVLVDGALDEPAISEAMAQQDLFEEWLEDEDFELKLWECERHAVKLAEGVYVIGWDNKKGRPRISVYDPGFFFPDLESLHLTNEDFPDVVSIAYEFDMKDQFGEVKKYLRRIKWVLEDRDPYSLPWDDAASKMCVMSDGYWLFDDIKEMTDPNSLSDARATWLMEPQELGVDFIPVIMVSNFMAGQEFWSSPVLAAVMQLFDDIASTDTDLQAASSTSGTPALAVSGASVSDQEMTYGPGKILEVGDGSATVIDTSTGLIALGQYRDDLLERLSVNGRTPEALLGRVKPNEVPSGIALALGFSQHTNMITQMRKARYPKYKRLFKMVYRFFQIANAYGMIDEPRAAHEFISTNIVFGSYLPSDKEQAVEFVVQLLNAKIPGISLETAVNMLIEAGFPIEDPVLEINNIQKRDYETALKAGDATYDPNVGRNYLGLPSMNISMDQTGDEEAGLV